MLLISTLPINHTGTIIFFFFFRSTLMQIVERSTAVSHVVGLYPARNKYLYDLQIVDAGLTVCVCGFSMFVSAPTIQEIFLVCAKFFFLKITHYVFAWNEIVMPVYWKVCHFFKLKERYLVDVTNIGNFHKTKLYSSLP